MTILSQRRTLTIGTRSSKLALAQTELVRATLHAAHAAMQIAVTQITTRGDVVLDRPLKAIGGKGLFITEIEDALRAGTIDVAIHSGKDLPVEIPDDILLAAFPARADARDVVIAHDAGMRLRDLPAGARVGTSSARRACQLRHQRPDLQILDLRGNVDTRLRKLREGHYDAIILAAAGLDRLGLTREISEWLEPAVMIPAVAQGAIAIQTRAGDIPTLALFAAIDDGATHVAVTAERAFLGAVGGGCSVPVGAHAYLDGDKLRMVGMIGAADGQMVRGALSGPSATPAILGRRLAKRLLNKGGRELLALDEADRDD